jgi:hypothetical protein
MFRFPPVFLLILTISAMLSLATPGEACILVVLPGDFQHLSSLSAVPVEGVVITTADGAREPFAFYCGNELSSNTFGTDPQNADWNSAQTISGADLTNPDGQQRQAYPEPCTLAIWSLIGLCGVGTTCWRRRRSLFGISSQGGMASPVRRRASGYRVRPPWPDDVRMAIREVVGARDGRSGERRQARMRGR